MGNYSDKEDTVRVDFFREGGKWYTTEAMRWIDYDKVYIFEAFEVSLHQHFGGKNRLTGMWAVCLDPYHVYSHPLMVKVKDYEKGTSIPSPVEKVE